MQARGLTADKQDPAASEAWHLKPASDVDSPAPIAFEVLELMAGLAPAPAPGAAAVVPNDVGPNGGEAADGEAADGEAAEPIYCEPQYDACLAGCDPDNTQVRRVGLSRQAALHSTHLLHKKTHNQPPPAQCTAPSSADGSHKWSECCTSCTATFDACLGGM